MLPALIPLVTCRSCFLPPFLYFYPNSPYLRKRSNIDYFTSKPDDLPKTTILLDNGYHPEKLTQALEAIYPEMMTKIQFELSAKPSKAEKEAKGQSGFVPVAARWVVERSNAWVERCKSLGRVIN
jgi:Transposase DDE domain